jgi:hypothetical protein
LPEAAVTEEAKAKRSAGADAIQSAFGYIGNFVYGVCAHVAELLRLEVGPYLLDRVEVVG